MDQGAAQSLPVNALGAEIQRRRKAIGIDRQPFADEAGVSPTTLRKLEEGETIPRDKSLAKIRATLERLERERGVPTNSVQAETIEFTVEGDFNVKVTVKGPITDRAALEDSVANIIRRMREDSP